LKALAEGYRLGGLLAASHRDKTTGPASGSARFGDLERCALRPGNVDSADGWDRVLKPVVAHYRGKVSRIYFRAAAGFAHPDVYEFLEAEQIKYAIRLPIDLGQRGAAGRGV
jgi:hypothetical protein